MCARKKTLNEREKRIAVEVERLSDILSELPDEKLKIAEGLIAEAAFMRITLEDLKKDINTNGAIDEMPQGEYSILRESPAVKTYNTMVQRYNTVCKDLFGLLPKERANGDDDDDFDRF